MNIIRFKFNNKIYNNYNIKNEELSGKGEKQKMEKYSLQFNGKICYKS